MTEPRIGKGKTYPDVGLRFLAVATLTLISGAVCLVAAVTSDAPWLGAIGAGIALVFLALFVMADLPVAATLTLIGGVASEVAAVTTSSPWVGAIGAGIALLILAVLVIVSELW